MVEFRATSMPLSLADERTPTGDSVSSTSAIPVSIRAFFFYAVGTLLHPEPAVVTVYAATCQRFGSRLTAAEIAPRFRAAFRRQEDLDCAAGWRTDELREVARWRAIVREVLADVAAPEE